MKRAYRALLLAVMLTVFVASQASAVALTNCVVNNTGSNSYGQSWINVTVNSTTYNFLFPTATASTFLATALTALSITKNVTLDVTSATEWGGVNAIWITSN